MDSCRIVRYESIDSFRYYPCVRCHRPVCQVYEFRVVTIPPTFRAYSYCDSCVKKIKFIHDYHLEVQCGYSLIITYYDLTTLEYSSAGLVPRLTKI